MKPIPHLIKETTAHQIELMKPKSPTLDSPKLPKNNIEVQDIFQLMEHNQVIARRMQDL